MFPPTDSAKSGDDVFPTTDNVKDINPPRSLHVEAIILMTRSGLGEKKIELEHNV